MLLRRRHCEHLSLNSDYSTCKTISAGSDVRKVGQEIKALAEGFGSCLGDGHASVCSILIDKVSELFPVDIVARPLY